jgi:purine-binding chemotaxis protein CheW
MTDGSKGDDPTMRAMVAFLVGSREFGVDVTVVREIRVWTPAIPIAHSPNFVCGVINLRGTVLPMIDRAARLGLPPTQPTTRHAILVIQIGNRRLALLVESASDVEGVSEILTVSRDLVQPPPEAACKACRAKSLQSRAHRPDPRPASRPGDGEPTPSDEPTHA